MLRLTLLLVTIFILSCADSKTDSSTITDDRPNILVILLDDLGYSDMGCYGSEIATPNMDELAAQGQRFSQYCTAPMCAPTRAMLLSGNDNHIEGMGRMMSVRGNHRNYLGLPHYEEDISDRVILFPKLLQKSGYYTCMTGKWHLGWADSSDPYLHGFDDTWALRNSFANYYDARNYGISDIKLRDTISMYTNNGKSVTYPVGKHATEVYTDNAISYFNRAKTLKKPFFTYLAYTAPHWPLQVEEKYCEPYIGQYDDGFRAVMKRRLKGLKDKGIIPVDTPLPAYPDVPKWESLSELERKLLARKMELQAGLIAHLDEHIGKVIQSLKNNGQYENTIIFLLSDHGAGAETFTTHPVMKKIVNDTLINNLENLGKPSSFAMIGKEWAQVCSVPFRKYKGTMFSGGVNAPFIIAGAGIPKSKTVRKGFFTVQDIAPTILELAEAAYPKTWEGKNIFPLRGQSVLSFFQQQTEQPHPANYSYGMEHWDDGMIQKGKWKIVNCTDASNEEAFELYDTAKDISELNNLKDQEPKKYQELLADWQEFKKEVGVIFLE